MAEFLVACGGGQGAFQPDEAHHRVTRTLGKQRLVQQRLKQCSN